jgi:hypothetical protein
MKYVALIWVSLFYGVVASAHGSGLLLEQPAGNYRTDIDYSAGVIREGRPGRFTFNIIDVNTENFAKFTDVGVNIENQEGEVLFSGNFSKDEFGQPSMTYTFHDAGKYKMITRFNDSGNLLAEASFDLEVERGEEESFFDANKDLIMFLLPALIAGIVIGYIIKANRNAT